MATRQKTGGRQPNTPNKKTIEAQDKADKLGIDPFELLLYYAKRDHKKLGYKSIDEISPELAASSASKACEYLLPKRKSVEVSGEMGMVTEIQRTVISKKV